MSPLLGALVCALVLLSCVAGPVVLWLTLR